jgi:hypothetical protein
VPYKKPPLVIARQRLFVAMQSLQLFKRCNPAYILFFLKKTLAKIISAGQNFVKAD